jgi:hypothetical protein
MAGVVPPPPTVDIATSSYYHQAHFGWLRRHYHGACVEDGEEYHAQARGPNRKFRYERASRRRLKEPDEPMVVPTPTPDIDGHYFDLATQYYLAARWATFTIAGAVAGNLFHHAIELYLKGGLSRNLSRPQLKKLGHDLRRLWKVYKQKYSASELSGFDSCIRQLHRFETIRYPDAVAEKGMFFAIPVSRPQPPLDFPVFGGGSTPPTYFVVVNDIDQLIKILFTIGLLNPDFFFAKLTMEAKAVLHRDNPAFPAA